MSGRAANICTSMTWSRGWRSANLEIIENRAFGSIAVPLSFKLKTCKSPAESKIKNFFGDSIWIQTAFSDEGTPILPLQVWNSPPLMTTKNE